MSILGPKGDEKENEHHEKRAATTGRFCFPSPSRDAPSAGASGALFGLVGVLFVFGIKFRHELPEGFKRAFGTGLIPMIVLNLFIGYLGRGLIDNAAHLGGLISGADATQVAMCHFLFDSTESFLEAFTPHAAVLQGDIPNYTNIEPVIEVHEVVLSR